MRESADFRGIMCIRCLMNSRIQYKPDEFIPAIVTIDNGRTSVRYVRKPFNKEPDFKATSVNYDLVKLMAQA